MFCKFNELRVQFPVIILPTHSNNIELIPDFTINILINYPLQETKKIDPTYNKNAHFSNKKKTSGFLL